MFAFNNKNSLNTKDCQCNPKCQAPKWLLRWTTLLKDRETRRGFHSVFHEESLTSSGVIGSKEQWSVLPSVWKNKGRGYSDLKNAAFSLQGCQMAKTTVTQQLIPLSNCRRNNSAVVWPVEPTFHGCARKPNQLNQPIPNWMDQCEVF